MGSVSVAMVGNNDEAKAATVEEKLKVGLMIEISKFKS